MATNLHTADESIKNGLFFYMRLFVDVFLAGQVTAFEEPLQPLLKHFFEGHGKRLRANLLCFSGYHPEKHKQEDLVKGAAILEMVHYATLIHDDILDQTALRQSSPTLWAEKGPKIAVLAGDALFAHALVLASDYPTPRICQIVARATKDVCSGEILQTLLLEAYAEDRKAYEKVIALKTAALFEAATHLGALIGGFSDDFVAAARRFGCIMGLAYQILDDAADYWSKEAQAGKTLGTDFSSGKQTLPIFLLNEGLSPSERQQFKAAWQSGALRLEDALALFEQHGIRNKVQIHFLELIEAALAAVAPHAALPPAALYHAMAEHFKGLWLKHVG
jgi:octaprenyl-diphosphate synthase